MDQPNGEWNVVSVPVFDTGIGREAGYESDRALVAAATAEREAMEPDVRRGLEKLDAAFEREVLGL